MRRDNLGLPPLRLVVGGYVRISGGGAYVPLECGHRAQWYGEERARRRCEQCKRDRDAPQLTLW